MDRFIAKLRAILHKWTAAAPGPRPDAGQSDWLPPVLDVSDFSSPYFLAMADRDAAWYFDRR